MGGTTRTAAGEQWRSDEVLAWTDQEGPGRGPAAPGRAMWLVVAGALAVVFAGILSSDTLCPEHRLWVLLIGGASLIAAGTALIGLIDGWAGAPLLAMLSALGGIGVGVIDAVHAPTRGRLVAIGFGLVFLGASWLVWRQQRQRRWDRQVEASLRPLPPVEPSAMPAPAAGDHAPSRPPTTTPTTPTTAWAAPSPVDAEPLDHRA